MKKSRRWKLAVFALLFAGVLAGTMQLTAAATAIEEENVEVDYINETITVTAEDDTVIYFTESYHKDISKWDVCEVRDGKAAFDISWVNENKTVRIYLCGDVNQDVISVDIIWEEDFNVEFTGTLLTTDITEASMWKQVYEDYPAFSEDTGYFLFTLDKNGRDTSYFELENIEWRKGDDGVWRKYEELDLKEMNIRGISLEFRIVANEEERASSTAKITVSKLNSAPGVLVNPNTMTLGIKNGMEFSFDKETWILVPEYSKKFGTEDYLVTEDIRANAIEEIYTSERISTLIIQEVLKTQASGFTMNTPMNKANLEDFNKNGEIFKLTEEGIVLYVREIGTNRKAASKIAEVIIPYASEDMAMAQPGALEFSYGESKTNTGGIVVKNTTEYKYQVCVITPEEWEAIGDAQDDINLSGRKWTSIKGGKTLKLSNKKVPKGSYLVYRIAGEDGQLPSTYRIYGPMAYDELTYAGMTGKTMAAGEVVTAVVNADMSLENENLAFQWQRCADVKAEEPEWTDIPGATAATYEMTNDDAHCYVRVKITNVIPESAFRPAKEIVMFSDHEGPVRYVTPEGEENTENTENTETE